VLETGAVDFQVTGLASDGDDHIEGNGGADTIYGGLGQDDIIGGSSSLFSLDTREKRPDGVDVIHGGDGAATGRNDVDDDHGSDREDGDRDLVELPPPRSGQRDRPDEIRGGVQCQLDCTVEVEGGGKPALVAEVLFRYYA